MAFLQKSANKNKDKLKNDQSFVCVNIERKQMFVYLRCDKKKEQNLANGMFFIISRVFSFPLVFPSSKIRFQKDIRRGTMNIILETRLKSEASIISCLF